MLLRFLRAWRAYRAIAEEPGHLPVERKTFRRVNLGVPSVLACADFEVFSLTVFGGSVNKTAPFLSMKAAPFCAAHTRKRHSRII